MEVTVREAWNRKTKTGLEDGENETHWGQSVLLTRFLKHQSEYKNNVEERYLSDPHVFQGVSCDQQRVRVACPLTVKGLNHGISRIYLITIVRQQFCLLSHPYYIGLKSQV